MLRIAVIAVCLSASPSIADKAPRPPPKPALKLTSLSPDKGDTSGGTYVVLKGERFLKDGPRNVKVYFGSRQGSVVRFASDTEIIVQAPSGTKDEVVDVVAKFDPGGEIKLVKAFTFVDGPSAPSAKPGALKVTSIDPKQGDADGGTFAVLKGERFLKDGPRNVKVYFGSRQGSIIRFQSDRELIVQAPAGKPNEVVDVLVIFDPGGTLTLPRAFTFVDKNDGPSIDDLPKKK